MKLEGTPYKAPQIGSNIRITVAANQGGRKYMEDRVNIETIRNPDGTIKFTFLGVFDGHGGFEASEYVRKNLLANIMASENFESEEDFEILEGIKEGFLATHEEMTKVVSSWPRTPSGYPSTAGTTASVAIIRNGKVYTGHVGDSAVIIGSYKSDQSIGNKVVFESDRLTIDHKPESLEEMARIELAGGRVALKSGVARVVWTRPCKGHIGPIQKNTPTESLPFLAVARSLGDLWSYCPATGKYAVSPEPDLAVRVLTEDDSCIVLISDGVTNVLANNQVVQFVEFEERKLLVSEDKDPKELHVKQPNHARVILSQAMKRWAHLRADNLSAIVAMFDPVHVSQEAYCPYIDEQLSLDQSIDEMFLMDPECMMHVCETKTQKLWTERVSLVYEGALDNNFSTVDYRGPGFLTHDEEEEIEARLVMREKLRESYKTDKSPVCNLELDGTIDPDFINEEGDMLRDVAKENVNCTSSTSTEIKLEVTVVEAEEPHSDEEEPSKETSPFSIPLTPSQLSPKTRSSAKHIAEINSDTLTTPTRKIAIAQRRLSIVKTVDFEKIEGSSIDIFTTPGVTTRSQDRKHTAEFLLTTPSSSVTPSPFRNGSRKRTSKLMESAGVTPYVERLRITSSPIKREEPRVCSEPSTPAKAMCNDIKHGSNWSLSKLDTIRVEDEDAEPPSKIRRIYGFMRRLVGLGKSS